MFDNDIDTEHNAPYEWHRYSYPMFLEGLFHELQDGPTMRLSHTLSSYNGQAMKYIQINSHYHLSLLRRFHRCPCSSVRRFGRWPRFATRIWNPGICISGKPTPAPPRLWSAPATPRGWWRCISCADASRTVWRSVPITHPFPCRGMGCHCYLRAWHQWSLMILKREWRAN